MLGLASLKQIVVQVAAAVEPAFPAALAPADPAGWSTIPVLLGPRSVQSARRGVSEIDREHA